MYSIQEQIYHLYTCLGFVIRLYTQLYMIAIHIGPTSYIDCDTKGGKFDIIVLPRLGP